MSSAMELFTGQGAIGPAAKYIQGHGHSFRRPQLGPRVHPEHSLTSAANKSVLIRGQLGRETSFARFE